MTTELEQEFFKTFEIEPTIIDACKITDKYWNNEELANKYGCFALYMRENCPYDEDCNDNCKYAFDKIEYPEITDRVLLKLICIQGNTDYFLIDNSGNPINVNGLKKSVLHTLTLLSKNHKELKHQIQQLFKEGE